MVEAIAKLCYTPPECPSPRSQCSLEEVSGWWEASLGHSRQSRRWDLRIAIPASTWGD